MISVVRSRVLGMLCAGLLLGIVPAAGAQSVSGTILGSVTDPSGAVISNAKVTLVNEGTGLTRTVTTDTNGEYVAPSMPTGRSAARSAGRGRSTSTPP